jgi:hypothetical protein
MPPSEIDTNLSGLVNLVPDSMDELLQRIDQVRYSCRLADDELFVFHISDDIHVAVCLLVLCECSLCEKQQTQRVGAATCCASTTETQTATAAPGATSMTLL